MKPKRSDPQGERLAVIAWAPVCPRSDELARALGTKCHFVHFLAFQRPLVAALKYPVQTVRTLRILMRSRPRAVIVENPPLPAVICVALYCFLSGASFAIDSHSSALVDRKWAWSRPAQRWIGRRAAATLVHTPTLVSVLKGAGRVLVVEDPPPTLPLSAAPSDAIGSRVVVVGSFAGDEPIQEMLAAASKLPEVDFIFTGDTRRAPKRELFENLPPNVKLPGWLSSTDYMDLLRSAAVIVSLTTRDMTVLRGGWEAVYLGKPLVTSNWPALRNCFTQGSIFVDSDPDSISSGVSEALHRRRKLASEMERLRVHKRERWEQALKELRELLVLADEADLNRRTAL
jgi:glycosyltransferase involved in cell wall biosynthesis